MNPMRPNRKTGSPVTGKDELTTTKGDNMKKRKMKRKVINMIMHHENRSMVALCNDGTLWDIWPSICGKKDIKQIHIPQDEFDPRDVDEMPKKETT